MNAHADPRPDEIVTFCGDIPKAEYDRRAKLRSFRNAASALVGRTQSETARHLAWTVIEWASPNLYSPCPIEWLDKLNQLSKRLMLTALQVEEMDAQLREASDA